MIVGEREGTQFKIKLPIFKKKYVYFYITVLCQFTLKSLIDWRCGIVGMVGKNIKN